MGMESFGDSPDDPVEVCQSKVRESSALVVMVAHRYGWVPGVDDGGDGHKSITWIEVETALDAGVPVFAFLVDKEFGWTQPKEQDSLVKAKTEEEAKKVFQNVQALEDFRTFLETEAGITRDIFTTPDNLASKVATSLANWDHRAITAPAPTQRTRVFREVHPLQPATHFRGRQDVLKDLQLWWEDPVHPDRVCSLVAIGGAGKTAIIERFLKGIKKDKLKGNILVWSFYEEPNTDAFLEEACMVFAGETGEGVSGRLQRLQRALSGSDPHLLVLDGLERVQSIGKAGRAKGDLEDHRLKNLLRSIANGLGRTRALITSRFKLTDLEQWEGAGYRSNRLEVLDEKAAIEVLRAWKVKGEEAQLLDLAESFGRHALSVSVLGSYLNHYCHGDPKGVEELNLDELSEDEPQAARLSRILAGYAKALSAEERGLLVRLSVFPNGVSVEILGYLIDAGGEIAGALVGVEQVKLTRLADRLYKQGLVYTYNRRGCLTYTGHPFLRDYFRNLLGVPPEKIHEAVRKKLALGLDSRPETKPRDTEVLDRYEALIEHSILSGHVQEAYDLYKNTMGGGGGSEHLYHTIGDYGRIIRLGSLFSEDGGPLNLAPKLPIANRAYLINVWGLAADALGDLSTAECCFDKACELYRKNEDWGYFSVGLQNSALVAMARGRFPLAKKLLTESLTYAQEDDKHVRSSSHSSLAATCHALGEITTAKENFTKATKIEGEPLYSFSGLYEAEHLFFLVHKKKAYARIEENLTMCERNEWSRTIVTGGHHRTLP